MSATNLPPDERNAAMGAPNRSLLEHETYNPNPVTMHGDESWQTPGEECRADCRGCLSEQVQSLRVALENALAWLGWLTERKTIYPQCDFDHRQTLEAGRKLLERIEGKADRVMQANPPCSCDGYTTCSDHRIGRGARS